MNFTKKQIQEIIDFYKKEDDTILTEEEAIEVLKTENKVKQNYKAYTSTEKVKQKKQTKPRPLDKTKVTIIQTLAELLDKGSIVTRIEETTIANPQKEIKFKLDGLEYSLNLVCHRPPKK